MREQMEVNSLRVCGCFYIRRRVEDERAPTGDDQSPMLYRKCQLYDFTFDP